MGIKLMVAFIATTLVVYTPLSRGQEPERSSKEEDDIVERYKAKRVTPVPPDLQQSLADAIKQEYGVEPPSEIELYIIPQPVPSRLLYRRKKIVVRGVVVAERENEMYLDVKPCSVKLFAIQGPYTKEIIKKEKVCGDKKHQIVVVTFETPPARK